MSTELAEQVTKGLKTVKLAERARHTRIETADGAMVMWTSGKQILLPARLGQEIEPEGFEPNKRGWWVLTAEGDEWFAPARKALLAAIAAHTKAAK